MATYWNTDNPDKPWGKFDPNSTIDIPYNWVDWLADKGVAYAGHQMIAETPLQVVASGHANGIITAYIKVQDGQQITLNQKYALTCRITSDGSPALVEDRTVYLKAVER